MADVCYTVPVCDVPGKLAVAEVWAPDGLPPEDVMMHWVRRLDLMPVAQYLLGGKWERPDAPEPFKTALDLIRTAFDVADGVINPDACQRTLCVAALLMVMGRPQRDALFTLLFWEELMREQFG